MAHIELGTPLLKLPLLFATVAGVHVGFSPPRPPPAVEERKTFADTKGAEALPAVGSWGLVPFKVLTYTVESLEACIVVAGAYPAIRALPCASTVLKLAPGAFTDTGLASLSITPATLVGTLLVVAGAALRRDCYRRLGSQFTFELSIQRDHRLVTDGPYAVVRHPAYTALVTQALGLLLCLGGPGSWWREFACDTTFGRVVGVGTLLQVAVCLVCGINRAYKEDEVLERLFGDTWTEWARRTRWRMIPYVF